jgi:hypothetical protein
MKMAGTFVFALQVQGKPPGCLFPAEHAVFRRVETAT